MSSSFRTQITQNRVLRGVGACVRTCVRVAMCKNERNVCAHVCVAGEGSCGGTVQMFVLLAANILLRTFIHGSVDCLFNAALV